MSRLLTVGYELTPSGSYTWEIEGGISGTGTITLDTSVKRSGAGSRSHSSGAGNSLVYTTLTWPTPIATVFTRWYFRIDALPASTSRIAYLRTTGGAATLSVRLTAAGKLQLYNEIGAAQIGSDSTLTVATGTWYRVELSGTIGTGATDSSELRVALATDTGVGETVASQTGASYTDLLFDQLWHGWLNSPGANKKIWLDDTVVNSTAGTSNNSWAGHSEGIVYLYPISDNARGANWTAGAGATSNLFEAVNNNPPVGVAPASATDASQIKNTNTADTTGNYDANMTSYATAGLTASHVVKLVQAVISGGSSSASTGVPGAIRIVSNPAQGSEDSQNIGANVVAGTYPASWFYRYGTAIDDPSVTLSTQPVMRVGRRSTNPAEAHVCSMFIAVEYQTGLDSVLPDADITTTGWSTAPLFSKINDSSDATVIQATAS